MRVHGGPRRRSSACVAGLALVLTACFGGLDADGDDDGEGGEGGRFEEGPAPGAVGSGWDGSAVRVDEVTRDGDGLQLAFVLANVAEQRFDDDDVRLLTDTGIELPRAPEQQRTLTTRSRSAVELAVTGLTEDIGRVTLDVAGVSVDVPVPPDGETFRWRPAPLRQVGLTDALVRDPSFLTLVLYTFRTEGLVSEVTFLAQNVSNVNPSLCEFRNIQDCYLRDRDGRTYPLLGPSHTFAEWGQVRGTLRFLGEIPPSVDELTLVMQGSSGFMTAADPNFEHTFAVPSADDSPARAVAQDTMPAPFEVGQTVGEGVIEVELGEMSFADDRIQLQVTATLGDGNGFLNHGGDAVLRDPTGFEHPLRGPPENRSLEFQADRTVETTLVFLTRVAPGVDQLELVFSNGRDREYGTTIELPASDDGAGEEDR